MPRPISLKNLDKGILNTVHGPQRKNKHKSYLAFWHLLTFELENRRKTCRTTVIFSMFLDRKAQPNSVYPDQTAASEHSLHCLPFRLRPLEAFEPRHEKTNVLVSDLVRHKPGYAVTEDG